MRIIKHKGEVYVEFTSVRDLATAILKCFGFAIIAGISFYALWILLDFLK